MAKAPLRTSETEAAAIEAAAADIAASATFRRQIFFWLAGAALLALFLYVF
ncbi:AI-2E family transporter, partial [Mesorhizobium sp. M7A.F.Ca.ET.027.03.2.1]